MSDSTLRVLIVEDSENDALLLVRALKKGGYNPISERVDTPEAMREAIGARPWDIVIADYAMPRFSGLAALKLLQEKGLDIPFILISGTIGEDTAVKAMKAGANDYIMKDNLTRLTSAIARELKEFEIRVQRKKAEDELRSTKELLRLQIAHMPIGCITWDLDFKVASWNPAAEQIFGYTAEETIGKRAYDLIASEETRRHIDDVWRGLLKGSGKTNSTDRNFTKKGQEIICEWHNAPLRDNNGSVVRVLSMVRDITELKKAELARDMSEANYRTIFESASDAIVIQDINTYEIAAANNSACEMFGYTKEEIVGLNLSAINVEAPPYTEKNLREHYNKVTFGKPQFFEWLLKNKDGRPFWVEISSNGTIVNGSYHVMSVIRDITERKQLSEQKDNFVNLISHELRTPLGAIKESISLIAESGLGTLSDEQKMIADIAKRNTDRLARLIDQVLTFQKINIGKLDLEMSENDMNAVIAEIYKMMVILAKKRDLKIILKLDDRLPRVRFDKDKMTQVLINLVDNAIKATEKGVIEIASIAGNNFIEVSVKDTGRGIKTEDMPKLFQQFVQIGKKTGGTGLGLAICKNIIEAHKGRIEVKSKFGEGSTFCIVLPCKERRS